MKLIRCNVSQRIAEGAQCGGGRLMFIAPINLEPGDIVAADYASGQPHAIYRPSVGTIWTYQEPEHTTVEISGKIDADALKTIWKAFGAQVADYPEGW